MSKDSKLCPLGLCGGLLSFECQGSQCGWWVAPYTTEGLPTGGMCAIKMLAMKNSEGQYRV